ncbi:MAG: helix-turn-helix transcriptional regulator [Clostridia bacterium]|nr:helix-turn-helix transcriptional regulator [Clostridia bacterium]
MVRIGAKICELRRSQGLSQEELASRLYITRQALSKWENGSSIPSIDLLVEVSRLFSVSIDEILCLGVEPPDIDPEDIFRGHTRDYIVKMVAEGKLDVKLSDVFYQFSPIERIYILRSIKDGELAVDRGELWVKLTPSEQRFLGGEI